MIGYKAFDKNLCCKGFQFEVGKTYETGAETAEMNLCTDTVFHFCRDLYMIENVSDYKLSESRICEVISGDYVTDKNRANYGTNKLTILREIVGDEKDGLLNIRKVIIGSYNTGNYNTGDYNTGNSNTGNSNTGDYNTGCCNTSDYNAGDYNAGCCNAGGYNTGNGNTGNGNTGNGNTGNGNTGNGNTGNDNTGNNDAGDSNTGNNNTGDYNTGDYNTGNCNTGDKNVGHHNTGNWNSGFFNTGNWNSGDWNSGFFNTDTPTVRMFNKDTGLSRNDILQSFPNFLYFDLITWVSSSEATDKEKQQHEKEIKITGGFLKKLDYKEAFHIAWDKADVSEHEKLLALPNWNNEIFKEISGIDAEAEIAKEKANENQ